MLALSDCLTIVDGSCLEQELVINYRVVFLCFGHSVVHSLVTNCGFL